MAERDALDPRELIVEAFKIEGIHEADCRSIFFDWALGLDPALDPAEAIRQLLERHADQPQDHPMIGVLQEGLNAPRREGRGRRRRRSE